jgi:hypothetical protein
MRDKHSSLFYQRQRKKGFITLTQGPGAAAAAPADWVNSLPGTNAIKLFYSRNLLMFVLS